MLFWRAKSAKQAIASKSSEAADRAASEANQAETDDSADASEPEADASEDDVSEDLGAGEVAEFPGSAEAEPDGGRHETAPDSIAAKMASKIIPISSAARLSERLAEVNKAPVPVVVSGAGAKASESRPTKTPAKFIEPSSDGPLSLQAEAVSHLKAALAQGATPAHVLVYGEPGTGRMEASLEAAREAALERAAGSDFIYAGAATDRSGRLHLFEVPSGTGDAIVRDVRDALQKASAMLSRHVAGDGHQMSLAMLEEDHRQRSNGGIEELKRRAEAQNIALVNTSEGFVLAPMHEGRVVRADVFRALPEALQREVEAKITAFEGELHSLLQALPGADIATDDRHAALCRQTAERALKPSLAVARKLTAAAGGADVLIDTIEGQWLSGASDYVRRGDSKAVVDFPALSVISAADQVQEGAPVVVARSVSPSDLCGEIGRDAHGAIVVRPGALSLAAGGFLIVDAWRLASDAQGYAALSGAIESGEVLPVASPGLAVRADAQPLDATIIVIAEHRSVQRLKAIDPGFEARFAEVVEFAEAATAFDLSEERFGAWASALAKRANFRPLAAASAPILYDDARSRAGDMARVSLDASAVVVTLTLAERRAAGAGRDHISAEDVKAAVARRAVLKSVEAAP